MDVPRWDSILRRLEASELSEPQRELLSLLARGEQEGAPGRGHDLTTVLKDADA